jgi:hypothetical protein
VELSAVSLHRYAHACDGYDLLPDDSAQHGSHDAGARALTGDGVRILFTMWTVMMLAPDASVDNAESQRTATCCDRLVRWRSLYGLISLLALGRQIALLAGTVLVAGGAWLLSLGTF